MRGAWAVLLERRHGIEPCVFGLEGLAGAMPQRVEQAAHLRADIELVGKAGVSPTEPKEPDLQSGRAIYAFTFQRAATVPSETLRMTAIPARKSVKLGSLANFVRDTYQDTADFRVSGKRLKIISGGIKPRILGVHPHAIQLIVQLVRVRREAERNHAQKFGAEAREKLVIDTEAL